MARERRPRRKVWAVARPSLREAGTWLGAFAIAIGLWLFVNVGERTSERTLRVRLDLENLPSGMVVTNPVPDYVELRVAGSGLILSSIDPKSLHVALDLSGVRPGVATYSLGPKDFPLPRKVDVERVSPSRVSLHIDRLSVRTLPVRLDRRGELKEGLRLARVEIEPDEVRVSGPRSRLAAVRVVETRAVDLGELSEGTTEREVELVSPGGLMQLRRGSVGVRFVVERAIAQRRLEGVPVVLEGEASSLWRVRPARVDVVVRGTEPDVGRLTVDSVSVSVAAADLQGPGPSEVEPRVELPPGLDVVAVIPARVRAQRIVLKKSAAAAEAAGEAAGRKAARPGKRRKAAPAEADAGPRDTGRTRP